MDVNNNKDKTKINNKFRLDPFYKVVQSNPLVLAEHKLKEANTLKSFKMLLSMIDTSKKNNRIISVKKRDVVNFLFPSVTSQGGVECENISGEYYKKSRDCLRKLLDVKIIIENEKSTIYTVLCAYVEWEKNDDNVHVAFSEKLSPYIYDLKENFTQYEIGIIKNIKNLHAIRLYEYFKMMVYDNQYAWEVNVQELKKILNLKDKYKEFRNFKLKILIPAIKEITSTININGMEVPKTGLDVNFKTIKGGYRNSEVIGIQFNVKDSFATTSNRKK